MVARYESKLIFLYHALSFFSEYCLSNQNTTTHFFHFASDTSNLLDTYFLVMAEPRHSRMTVAEPTGLEPATSSVTGKRSNQLSYGST